jgi:hypothetical protein
MEKLLNNHVSQFFPISNWDNKNDSYLRGLAREVNGLIYVNGIELSPAYTKFHGSIKYTAAPSMMELQHIVQVLSPTTPIFNIPIQQVDLFPLLKLCFMLSYLCAFAQ